MKHQTDLLFTAFKRSCGKVMFLFMFVCPHLRGWGLPSDCAMGQVDTRSPEGRPRSEGRHPTQKADPQIRLTGGWYPGYWNAYLFTKMAPNIMVSLYKQENCVFRRNRNFLDKRVSFRWAFVELLLDSQVVTSHT